MGFMQSPVVVESLEEKGEHNELNSSVSVLDVGIVL